MPRFEIAQKIQEIFVSRMVVKIKKLLVKFKLIFKLILPVVAVVLEVVAVFVLQGHRVRFIFQRHVKNVIAHTFPRIFGGLETFQV